MEYMSVVISYEKYADFCFQTVMHRDLKATNVFFSKFSLNIIANFMEWNWTYSDEILETS